MFVWRIIIWKWLNQFETKFVWFKHFLIIQVKDGNKDGIMCENGYNVLSEFYV